MGLGEWIPQKKWKYDEIRRRGSVYSNVDIKKITTTAISM